jgi:serine phosphatase RsbU (regulator of sigma subunit)
VILNVISILMFISSKLQIAVVVVFVLFAIASIEIIRVIFMAIRKRKDGAWIFAFVILLAPLAGIVSSNLPDEFVISGIKIPNNTGAIVASCFVLGLPFSMALYLARDFANMGKQLKKQLKEITDLSETTLRQEKEKKQILENQKEELELKVVERTQEVWEQKNVIEIKNKEITDSLVYAKRIQTAMLPDINLLYKMLDQSFVLFQPKDIVSGDFYGFTQKQNKILVAAADCTGHGVAGAFMSIIGGSLLSQIINEKNITEPALILDHLNEGIIRSLKQKENESSDGMDISFCTFDLSKNELQFAGANRPLWLIRNSELLFYKANKYPIGGLQVVHDEKFTQHVIPLQRNDTIYMFSDGYADQFGGEKGKKLMTKRFREVLLSIQNKTMHEQKIYLQEYFESWKGNNEQVDDVLVIGIRV